MIYSSDKILNSKEATIRISSIHDDLNSFIKPGISDYDINQFVIDKLKEYHMQSATIGYDGYTAAAGVLINDCVCHAEPSGKILKNGDVVSIDIAARIRSNRNKGMIADRTHTYLIGEPSEAATRIVRQAAIALNKAFGAVRIGGTVSDIGKALVKTGFSIYKCFLGHGVGYKLHEEPAIYNYWEPKASEIYIKPGMIFTLEPILTLGMSDSVRKEGHAYYTSDGALSAYFERMIYINYDNTITML